MEFNTYLYILAFLPITVILYYFFNKISIAAGEIFLIIASLLFYTYSNVRFLRNIYKINNAWESIRYFKRNSRIIIYYLFFRFMFML